MYYYEILKDKTYQKYYRMTTFCFFSPQFLKGPNLLVYGVARLQGKYAIIYSFIYLSQVLKLLRTPYIDLNFATK